MFISVFIWLNNFLVIKKVCEIKQRIQIKFLIGNKFITLILNYDNY